MSDPSSRETQDTWAGESGYCNCLLVTMARMRIAKVELSTGEPLPNLKALAATRSETLEWINAQGFEYDKLDRANSLDQFGPYAALAATHRTRR